jgi:hypothetical protein
MEKKPLVDRLAEGEGSKKCATFHFGNHDTYITGGFFYRNTNDKASPGPGPTRSARGRGKPAGGKGPRTRAAPKTAEDLDKELEAFMGDGDSKDEKSKEEDVSMA